MVIGHGPLDVKKLGWTDWLKGHARGCVLPSSLYLFFVFLIILLINDKFLASMDGDTIPLLSHRHTLIVTII
jgi:hypothetical protein